MLTTLEEIAVAKSSGAVAAGTSAVNGAVVDMLNFETCVFAAVFGTSAVDNGLKVQQGAESDGSDMADLADSEQLLDGTETTCVVSIVQPRERYLRAVAVRGTSTTVDAIVAVQLDPRTGPQSSSSTDVAELQLQSPAEGTA